MIYLFMCFQSLHILFTFFSTIIRKYGIEVTIAVICLIPGIKGKAFNISPVRMVFTLVSLESGHF